MSTNDDRPGRATEGMRGKGYYDAYSKPQNAGIGQQEPRLRNAVRHLDLAGREALRIQDYGCGPGRTSISAFRCVLDELGRRGTDLPLIAVHNDQIGNDWNGLFANVAGPEGYLHDHPSLRVEASVGSFFDRVASPGSVGLGLSFAAAHWLHGPVDIPSPGSLFFCDLPEPARGEVAAMAARDWTDFLERRAEEMAVGGWFVVDALSSIPDAGDPSGRCAAGRGLYRAFWTVAATLADEGHIDRSLLDTFVFPVYFRLTEEVRAPFERDPTLRSAFEIIEIANERLPMSTEDALRETGDTAAYAASYAGFARAFSESTLTDGLFAGSTADAKTAHALADLFFDRLRDLFASEPHSHAFDHLVVTTVLRRR